MVLKRDKISKSPQGGYLFCNHCGGYYKLKQNESPRDFTKCECGNYLEYCKDRETLDLKVYTLHQNKEALDYFETKVLERREALHDFFPKITIDDDFINDFIKNTQEEEQLWDILDRETNITSQKKYLDIILEEERLMASIDRKKFKVKNPTLMDGILDFYQKTDPLTILGGIIVVLILVLILAVYKGG